MGATVAIWLACLNAFAVLLMYAALFADDVNSSKAAYVCAMLIVAAQGLGFLLSAL